MCVYREVRPFSVKGHETTDTNCSKGNYNQDKEKHFCHEGDQALVLDWGLGAQGSSGISIHADITNWAGRCPEQPDLTPQLAKGWTSAVQ